MPSTKLKRSDEMPREAAYTEKKGIVKLPLAEAIAVMIIQQNKINQTSYLLCLTSGSSSSLEIIVNELVLWFKYGMTCSCLFGEELIFANKKSMKIEKKQVTK